MERLKFLEMCQQVAVLPSGCLGIKSNVPKEIVLKVKGISYYPVAYELSFDKLGNPKHTAILHEINSNSVARYDLNKI